LQITRLYHRINYMPIENSFSTNLILARNGKHLEILEGNLQRKKLISNFELFVNFWSDEMPSDFVLLRTDYIVAKDGSVAQLEISKKDNYIQVQSGDKIGSIHIEKGKKKELEFITITQFLTDCNSVFENSGLGGLIVKYFVECSERQRIPITLSSATGKAGFYIKNGFDFNRELGCELVYMPISLLLFNAPEPLQRLD
jgi:hypothetical protein